MVSRTKGGLSGEGVPGPGWLLARLQSIQGAEGGRSLPLAPPWRDPGFQGPAQGRPPNLPALRFGANVALLPD